jgi:membrane protease YdiL (CAAX protease family)
MPSRAARILTFFVPAFVLTKVLAMVLWPGSRGTAVYWVKLNVLMLVPGLVAFALVGLVHRQPVRASLGLRWNPNRWWLAAWLLPMALAAAQIALLLLLPGTSFTAHPKGPWSILPFPTPVAALIAGLVAGATILIPGALGEESAWRGFLPRELGGRGFWGAALVIGALWAIWHIPATSDLEQIARSLSVGIGLVLATPLILFLRLRAGSVWAAVLFHATGNTAGHLPDLFVAGGTALERKVAGTVPQIVCILLIALALHRRRIPSALPGSAGLDGGATGRGESPATQMGWSRE